MSDQTTEATPAPLRKTKKGKPGSQDRGITRLNNGTYRVSCGWYTTEEGKRKPCLFYLGDDEQTARIKRDLIRAEQKRIKAEGHDTWPSSVLQRLADQGIIGHVVARKRSGETIAGTITNLVKQQINSDVAAIAELQQFKNELGQVIPSMFGEYVFSLAKNEVFDPTGEEMVRKALQSLKRSDPLGALKLSLDLWKMLQEIKSEKGSTQVNVNVSGGAIAFDESEKQQEEITRIIEGEAGDVRGDATGSDSQRSES